MNAGVRWDSVLGALAEKGWSARVVAAARLADLRARVAAVLDAGELPETAATHLADEVAFALPEGLAAARSVIVGAVARPLTQARLTVGGAEHSVFVPPHYAGYFTVPDGLTETASAALAPFGHRALRFEPPLKTLAACAGLARYGRNNLAYVPGLGSYLMLAACASDAPPPDDAVWIEPPQLARCERCGACLRAWHTCAVGCLRCQLACPANAGVELLVEPPEVFDERESAAILAATARSALAPATLTKLARCGLDYSPDLIARNLLALIAG